MRVATLSSTLSSLVIFKLERNGDLQPTFASGKKVEDRRFLREWSQWSAF